jgi:acyl-CoA synthetase (AMP-forming)/AMP-acid ligase II
MAGRMPDAMCVAEPLGRDGRGKLRYRQVTFRELDNDSNRIAAGLHDMGAVPGTRLVLMVPPSIDFISLVFATFKAGAVAVLIDPGMGRGNMIRCLEEVEPQGFIAIPIVQALRTLMQRCFRQARFNVTVGRRWFWGGLTLDQLRARGCNDFRSAETTASHPAAIIFTTGSTGPPKGVLYRHGNFDKQTEEIRDYYRIQPGEIDLSGFPLFALFNAALGVSTVIPLMEPTRPANVEPKNVIDAVRDFNITQAFGSPALWNTVGRYCEQHGEKMPTLRRVLSAGAPVPPHVLWRVKQAFHPDGEIHTPYGATESLPVASISASEVLGETAVRSQQGAGTCVGHRFPGIQWKVIRVRDAPIGTIADSEELPAGEIGELIVQGGVVTSEYVTRREANAWHKIKDGKNFWHRMGDVGYLDEQGRFWFCGRKAHRVQTSRGTMFTIPCEAIINQHPHVYRSALVGVGQAGRQMPVIVVEPWPEHRPKSLADRQKLIGQLAELAHTSELTTSIEHFLLRRSLPVDIRHNSKIFREKLAVWAAQQLRRRGG